MGEKSEKIKEFIMRNLGYFIVVLACFVYIFREIIVIDETGKSIYRIILDGTLSFLFGILINRILELQGFANGERDLKVIKTNDLHSTVVNEITPYINKLEEFCEKKNKQALINARTFIVKNAGLNYEDCFDEGGCPKDYEIDFEKYYYKGKDKKRLYEKKREIEKYNAYKKACKVKISLLSTSSLTNVGGNVFDPFNFGKTKKEYIEQSSKKDIISKVCVALIVGYYGVSLIRSFSWQNLIWTGLQVMLFLLSGTIKMMSAKGFTTGELRYSKIKKIDILQEFKAEYCIIQDDKETLVATAENEPKIQEDKEQDIIEISKGENVNV